MSSRSGCRTHAHSGRRDPWSSALTPEARAALGGAEIGGFTARATSLPAIRDVLEHVVKEGDEPGLVAVQALGDAHDVTNRERS